MPAPDTPELPFDGPRRWAMVRGAGSGAVEAQTEARAQEPATAPPVSEKPAVEKLELFQAATERADDGYTRWKAEVAAAREAQAATRRAAELPVTDDGAGYAAWKAEAEEAKRAFEQRWGVPLGKPVRLQLRGELQEREGTLHLADDSTVKSSRNLQLRLGEHRFAAAQIESLVRL